MPRAARAGPRLTACAARPDDAEMFEILGNIKHLKQLDNQLAGMLGTVIPRGGVSES